MIKLYPYQKDALHIMRMYGGAAIFWPSRGPRGMLDRSAIEARFAASLGHDPRNHTGHRL